MPTPALADDLGARQSQPWPPDYTKEFARRQQLILKLRQNPSLAIGAKAHYRNNPVDFIQDWGITYDPRNAGSETPTFLPFVMFKRQREFIEFLWACLQAQADGLNEKSRDMGSTWLSCAFSVWLWLFVPGAAVGWGSRKADLVDTIGDPDSIFEKMRIFIRYLPKELLPKGFSSENDIHYMKITNPENGANITGESGDNIGRGGRKLIYFKDESAHYEHPEMIEAALGDNTRVQIDISSVHGLGNVFQRRRDAGVEWVPGTPARHGVTNVFIMDWRDHPAKNQAWYEVRKQKAMEEGLLHVFAQEVDRDYAASVEGVVIPYEWVQAAVDAHLKLDYLEGWDEGMYGAGLDVADEGLDRNALVVRRGPIITGLWEWGERDTGVTARRVVGHITELTPIEVQYDCIGVGSGVKAEINRLNDDDLLPKDMTFAPWNAGSRVLNPMGRVNEGDLKSPRNKDFYKNLKAQGWWMLGRRFERTYKAVIQGDAFDPDDMISIPSDLPLLRSLMKELSQPTIGRDTSLKLIVNKTPDGTKSPNLGDAVMMAFWPLPSEPRGVAVFQTYSRGA